MVQIVGCLDGDPGLGVVHYADNIDDVICWIQATATAPAVLVAAHLFGPDVTIRCSSPPLNSTDTPGIVLLMGQLKSYTSGNKINAGMTTIEAITSLHPNHWFKEAVSRYCSHPIKNLAAAIV